MNWGIGNRGVGLAVGLMLSAVPGGVGPGTAFGQSAAGEWLPRFAGLGADKIVSALTVADLGDGPSLYAGGGFLVAGGAMVNMVARLEGNQWVALGEGIDLSQGMVWSLTEYDDGSGPALYVAGDFTGAAGKVVNHIAKWDGQEWWPLGEGMNGTIRGALAVYDDGNGPALYAGGDFWIAGGQPANHIAKWDGNEWHALGEGVDGIAHSVRALVVHDDGTGPALFVGGNFSTAGGQPAVGIAKWDGQQWHGVGGGVWHEKLSSRLVRGLVVYDDGSGPVLIATGQFSSAGGVPASGIAQWDGQSWSALGDGLAFDPPIGMTGRRLAVVQAGARSLLYAGGRFTVADGLEVNYLAQWDGTSWAALSTGMDEEVFSLTAFDEGDGPALFAGGNFSTAGGVASPRFAKWRPDFPDFDSDDDGDVDLIDLEQFVTCRSGPASPATPECRAVHDHNYDQRVDLADFQFLQAAFTGAR